MALDVEVWFWVSRCGFGYRGVVLGIEVWFSILRNRGVNGRSRVQICVVEAIACLID